MRHVVFFTIPHEPFNPYVRDRSPGGKMGRILEETSPEAVYFSTNEGQQGGIAVYNIEKASDLPSMAVQWFLTFEAGVQFQPCMSPEDLMIAGPGELGEKWG